MLGGINRQRRRFRQSIRTGQAGKSRLDRRQHMKVRAEQSLCTRLPVLTTAIRDRCKQRTQRLERSDVNHRAALVRHILRRTLSRRDKHSSATGTAEQLAEQPGLAAATFPFEQHKLPLSRNQLVESLV